MDETDLIKLFEGVPTTHLFRNAKILIQDDVEAIKELLKTELTEVNPEDFDDASDKVGQIRQLIDYIMEIGMQDNPYLQAQTIQNKTKLRKDEFTGYEDFYSFYRNSVLPSAGGKSYFSILQSDIFGCLGNLTSFCKLAASLLRDEKIDYSEVSELMQISDELSWRFEAIINAAADYEKQLFG